MPEAITKFAINSTLGTNKFKPLDQIIMGEKRFVTSDTTICVLKELPVFNKNSTPISTECNFAPKIDGAVTFSILFNESATPPSTTLYVDVYILEDSNIIYTNEAFIAWGETGGMWTTRSFSANINVNKGKKYSVFVRTSSTGMRDADDYLNYYANVKAGLLDIGYFDYNVEG